eukprot:650878-Lingulodinium_polyedra.AAC.1
MLLSGRPCAPGRRPGAPLARGAPDGCRANAAAALAPPRIWRCLGRTTAAPPETQAGPLLGRTPGPSSRARRAAP